MAGGGRLEVHALIVGLSRIFKKCCTAVLSVVGMTTSTKPAAHGEFTDNGRPRTSTTLTPFLAVPRAREAIDFYVEVFGARVVDVTEFPGEDGPVVAHAVLDFGLGQLQLGEPQPAYHLVAPPEGEDDCYSMGVFCPDVDAVVERAVAAGATVREPAVDFVSGDRFASIRDPFGIRWSVLTRVEDISDEESARRVAEWAAQQG